MKKVALTCTALAFAACGGRGVSSSQDQLIEQTGCHQDSDCPQTPQPQVCDSEVTQECQVSCLGSDQDSADYQDALCPAGERCNPTNGFCRGAGGTCSTDADCAASQICTIDANGDSVCLQGCDANVTCSGNLSCNGALALCSSAGQPQPLGADPDAHPRTPTKFPILFAHGFNASTVQWAFSDAAITALENDGHQVFQGDVPPFDTVPVRATQLLQEVQNALQSSGASQINLVCHSMGGLDCRYLASAGGLGQGGLVASITTIATPHQGTPVADQALVLLNAASFADPLLDALAALWGQTFSDQSSQANVLGALQALAVANAPAFNANTPDAQGVYYQSWAGVATVFGGMDSAIASGCRGQLLNSTATGRVEALLLANVPSVGGGLTNSIPNDGLVQLQSAVYGTFQGCIPTDHIEEVGAVQVGLATTGPQQGINQVTGWDPVRFYRNLAYQLADLGY
jgi:triacylglycerol lipase